jgi:hypothetical protein
MPGDSLELVPELVPGSRSTHDGKMTPWQRSELIRELAIGTTRRFVLARQYGVNRSYITLFAKRYALQIDRARADLADEFAHLWVASKVNRIADYQDDLEVLEYAMKEVPTRYLPEFTRARESIRKAVAEELGALPPRTQVVAARVTHVLEGFTNDELKGYLE